MLNWLRRLAVLAERVFLGMIAGLIGLALIWGAFIQLSKPFAQASVLSIVGGLLLGGFSLIAFVFAWIAASGEFSEAKKPP